MTTIVILLITAAAAACMLGPGRKVAFGMKYMKSATKTDDDELG